MALTAQPTQPPHGISRHTSPVWDEAIVPTLRKRLEGESRALTKRMSTQSIPPDDASALRSGAPAASTSSSSDSRSAPRRTLDLPRNEQQRPSAIPRPSFQSSHSPQSSAFIDSQTPKNSAVEMHPRNLTESPTSTVSSSSKLPSKQLPGRARTLSTPYPFNDLGAASSREPSGSGSQNGTYTPESSRAASPMTHGRPLDSRPSRIPTPATRARSGSKSNRAPPSNLVNVITNEHRTYENIPHSAGLDDRIPMDQPRIRDERAPFPATQPDTSVEQEHHFEHWYRGEGRDGGGRNGGIGELKVGTREMLEIALAGHQTNTLARRRAAGWLNDPEYPVLGRAIGRAATDELVWEISHRYSRHFEEPLDGEAWERVMDEAPLTDVDTDVDATSISLHYEEAQTPTPQQPPRSTSPHQPSTPSRKSTTHTAEPSTPRSPRPSSPTALPTPTRNGTQPLSKTQASARKPKPSTSSTRTTTTARSGSAPRTDTLADAIPAVPTPDMSSSRNWDEVVLPTVAKKIQLQKMADGTLTTEELYALNNTKHQPNKQPNRVSQEIIPPPAPGTFGYDPSKQRPPRTQLNEIQMDEFGAKPLQEENEEIETPVVPPSMIIEDLRPIAPLTNGEIRSGSPAPFASYAHQQPSPKLNTMDLKQLKEQQKELRKNKPAITVTSPSALEHGGIEVSVREDKVEHNGGCCARCVIM